MKNLATLISYIFHPLLMATYGCILVFFGLTETIYFVFTPFKIKILLTFTVFTFTVLLPLLNLLILHKLNYVSTLKIEKREERFFPLLITSFCYLGLFYMLYDFNIWPIIKLFILGAGISIMVAAIISKFWQISAHMIGVGGFIGLIFSVSYFMQIDLFIIISLFIIVAGIVGFSRLYLNAHSPKQIYLGFMVGCIIQFSLFLLAQNVTFV
jgi:membrane-associated phospholipid phosphatase